MNVDELIHLALQQARQGNLQHAQQTLAQALKSDPTNPRAWYLLSFLVENRQSQIFCLQQILKTHPGHPAASRRLSKIMRAGLPALHHPLPATPQPVRKKRPVWLWLLSLAFIGFVILFGGAFLWLTAPQLQNVVAGYLPLPAQQATAIPLLSTNTSVSTPTPTTTPSRTHTIFPTPTSTPTPTASPTSTFTVTFTPAWTPTASPTSTQTITTVLIPPPQAQINSIYGTTQKMPLSCEASSAVDWAGYFGVQIDEFVFQNQLPLSDNPDLGYVGSVMGVWGQIPPHPYGVHARPVAELLQTYGLNAVAVQPFSMNGIQQEIAAARPVIVWVTGAVQPGTSTTYFDSQGERTQVAPYQHTVLVIGYSETTFTILDGSSVYYRDISTFMQSWQNLGFQAVILEP